MRMGLDGACHAVVVLSGVPGLELTRLGPVQSNLDRAIGDSVQTSRMKGSLLNTTALERECRYASG